MSKYGTVEYKGKTLIITQLPYVSSSQQIPSYEAVAEDDEFEYIVTWTIVDEDCTDDSDACDWDDYTVTKLGLKD